MSRCQDYVGDVPSEIAERIIEARKKRKVLDLVVFSKKEGYTFPDLKYYKQKGR